MERKENALRMLLLQAVAMRALITLYGFISTGHVNLYFNFICVRERVITSHIALLQVLFDLSIRRITLCSFKGQHKPAVGMAEYLHYIINIFFDITIEIRYKFQCFDTQSIGIYTLFQLK